MKQLLITALTLTTLTLHGAGGAAAGGASASAYVSPDAAAAGASAGNGAGGGGGGGAPPALTPQPAAPMPEASPAEPPPAPPSVAASAPEPNSISQLPPTAVPAPEAGSMSAASEGQPQPTSASSDLVVNSANAPASIMTPPPAVAGETAETPATREAFESPVTETATQPQLGIVSQNAFRNGITPSQNLPVLSNFQVQQSGKALRIVDEDGSVYVGSWRLADNGVHNEIVEQRALQNSDKQGIAKTSQTPVPPTGTLSDNLQAAQNYLFRVRGMNRTLKLNVVFTGSLLANYALSGNMQQTFGGAVANANRNEQQVKTDMTNQNAQLPWYNLRITGTAVVNRTNYIEVNAEPVTPVRQN